MDTDESFEKWFDDKWKSKLEDFPRMERIRLRNIAKAAWKASRSAIEIKIDSHDEFEIEHMTGFSNDYAIGWIDARNYAARQVKEAGITVKGE